jgi:hypothetical protein
MLFLPVILCSVLRTILVPAMSCGMNLCHNLNFTVLYVFIKPSKPSCYLVYCQVYKVYVKKNLHSAHTVHLCVYMVLRTKNSYFCIWY